MSKPVVAIVGRPNVGKSTLFNALAGERISIVQDTPGVTRDRIYAEVSWLDHNFTMIDTGGIEPDSNDIILSQMREQAEIAIATADVIMFIVDVRQGLQDSDSKVADMLRRSGKPVVLVVNKVDSFEKYMADVYEFYNLGIGDPFPVSAASMLGLGDMLDEVVKYFPEYKKNDEEDDRPKIAIIGKPNVGKSSLINKLAQEDRVIVSDIAGTTRDAIATADVIMFIVDVRQGLQDSDSKVADMLRRSGKPVVLVVNKVDSFEKYMADVYEFYNLGIGDPFPVSAASMLGLGDMLDEVVKYFPEYKKNDEEDDRPKIAIIGKPNVGKSSLINKLAQEDRVIVSDIAGTTRDAIDTDIKYNGKEYVFIDTAGLRRKNKIKEEIERYSIIRAVTAVERADVCIIVIDATEGVTEQDAKIAGIAHDRGKGIIIAVNKWDAIEKDDKTIYRHTEKIRDILSFMPYAEIIFISAKSGQRLNKIFETIDVVIENNSMRVATGVLNEIVTEAVAMQQPPSDKGKRLRIYYTTQVSVKPPTFVIFVNDKQLMHFSYTRYLENRIRDTFGFRGTALRFIIRERKENEK